MLTAHIDLDRARYLMQASSLDALLLCTPENFFYGTGYSSTVFELYRQAPLAMLLLPARADIEPAIVVPAPDVEGVRRASGVQSVYGFPVWWRVHDLSGAVSEGGGDVEALLAQDSMTEVVDLPEQYDRREICRLLSRILRDRGLVGPRIGLELDFVDANTYSILQQANPAVEFVDSTWLMYELRGIKNSAEIDSLRKACIVTEAGIVAAAEAISEGDTLASITETFRRGVWAAARDRGLEGALGTVMGQPALGGQGGEGTANPVVCQGTTIKFDMQVSVSHYHSDIGRTYVFGVATSAQRLIHDALLEAHMRALEVLRPGTRFCDVFGAAQDSLQRSGLGRYGRGHFGHSVGLDAKIEEPPFISATEGRLLSPGMVLALETGVSALGVGRFHIEDMCLITEDGYELFNELPHELERLGRDT